MTSPPPSRANAAAPALRAMQIRLLGGIQLSCAAIGAVLLVASLAGRLDTPLLWNVIVGSALLLMVGLWAVLQRRPQAYVVIAALQNLATFALATYALWQPAAHEMRAAWFLIGLGAVYLLLGQRAGHVYTGATLLVVLGSNAWQVNPYSLHALLAFGLTFMLSSAGFHLFVGHALELYRQLSQRNQQFTLLTEQAEEVIWQFHPDMTVAYVSPADERARGYPAAEVVGRNARDLVAPEGAALLEQAIREAWPLVTLPMRCKDGGVRWFEMSGRRFRDPQGRPRGFHSMGRDVTQRMELERALQAERDHLEARVHERTAALSVAKQAAEAALRARSTFLSNMGHELRTPLTLIVGMTELARDRVSDQRVQSMLARALDAALRLNRLINDLIDQAALESRQLVFQAAPLSVPAVAAGAVQHLVDQARSKGLALALQPVGAQRADTHLGDARRIEQVLLHLLDNAIKFTHHGQVRLEVQALREESDCTLWALRVRDEGIGIAPADQARIFTLFEQVDGTSTRGFEGAGLGLALCQQLVEGMGGRLGVQSAPGRGSCFEVLLPLRRAG